MTLLNGKRAFVWQMISAAYLALFTPYLAWLTLSQTPQSWLELSQLLSSPSVLLPGLVAIGLLLIHAWIGLRDVLIDYAPRRFLMAFLLIMAFIWMALVANLFWLAIQIIGAHV